MLRIILATFFISAVISSYAQPANDNVCSATVLTLENGLCEPTTTFSWTGATYSSANGLTFCNGVQNRDVWFRATVPASGQLRVAAEATSYYAMAVEVMKGSACGSVSTVAEAVEGFPCVYTYNPLGEAPFRTYKNLVPGSFVFLRVYPLHDINIANAGIKLCVSNPVGLANEPCDAGFLPVEAGDPIGQACTPTITYAYTGATLSAGIPNPDCIGSMNPSNIRDVWMKLRVPASGKLLINCPYDGNYTILQVLSATACNGTFTQVGCAFGNPLSLSGLAPNSILYLRLFYWSGGANDSDNFKLCATSRLDVPAVNNSSGKVGIGIDSPFTKLQVVGSGFFHDKILAGSDIEARGNLIVKGKIISATGGNTSFNGIDATVINALDSLQMTNRLGSKIGLHGAMSGNHYGFGVQGSLMQIYSDAPGAHIGLGHGRSGSFTERVRIINNGENGMQVRGRMLLLNGTADINQSPGIWLYKPDNSALQAFMGVHTANNVGFYSTTPGIGWGFNFFNNTGNVGIGTSTGTIGRLDVVGGPSAEPVRLVIGNRGGFGPAGMDFISDYGLASQWTTGRIRTNDLGGFHGRLEFFTNVPGQLNTMTKGLEVGNGAAFTASGAVSSWSDARVKQNIQPFTDGLNVIGQINPVLFQYKPNAPFAGSGPQVGIIAQELEKVAPYMVNKSAENGAEDMRYVNNQAYVFLLINAVKELKQQLEAQQLEIEALKSKKKKHPIPKNK